MRYLFAIVAGLYFSVSASQPPPRETRDLTCLNYIEIRGETNINNFNLQQIIQENEICAPRIDGWVHYPGSSSYEIQIPVKNFNANNHFVYQDFLELVNASRFPYIMIQINNDQFKEFYALKNNHLTQIKISIAGVSKSVPVECSILECSHGEKVIIGNKTLKLTDFKLDPPVKSFGLIKVKNELNINFEFKMPEGLFLKIADN